MLLSLIVVLAWTIFCVSIMLIGVHFRSAFTLQIGSALFLLPIGWSMLGALGGGWFWYAVLIFICIPWPTKIASA